MDISKAYLRIGCKIWHEDGVWHAEAIDLPIAAFGDTFEEAKCHIYDAVYAHLEIAREKNEIDDIAHQIASAGGRIQARTNEAAGKSHIESCIWPIAIDKEVPIEIS